MNLVNTKISGSYGFGYDQIACWDALVRLGGGVMPTPTSGKLCPTKASIINPINIKNGYECIISHPQNEDEYKSKQLVRTSDVTYKKVTVGQPLYFTVMGFPSNANINIQTFDGSFSNPLKSFNDNVELVTIGNNITDLIVYMNYNSEFTFNDYNYTERVEYADGTYTDNTVYIDSDSLTLFVNKNNIVIKSYTFIVRPK